MNLNPIFSKIDGSSIITNDITVTRLSYDETGRKITQATIAFVSAATNEAYLTGFTTDVFDLYTTFSGAKGGMMA